MFLNADLFLGLSRVSLEAKLKTNIYAKKELKEQYHDTVKKFDMIKEELTANPTVMPELNTFLDWALEKHRSNATVTLGDELFIVDKYVGDVLKSITPLFQATTKLSSLIDETHKINGALEVAEEAELKAKLERERGKLLERRDKRRNADEEDDPDSVAKKRRYNKRDASRS